MLKLTDFGFSKLDRGNNLKTPVFTAFYVAPQVLESQSHQQKQQMHLVSEHETMTYSMC